MTTNFQKLINQCDDIDSMDDATIFSISGTKLQVLAQLTELENILDFVNCSITYIEDDSTGFEDDYEAYSVSTNLTFTIFNQLATPLKETQMHNKKLNQSQRNAGYIAQNVAKEPLDFLSEQNARLCDFEGGPMISYHKNEEFISIKCDDDGSFIVAVSTNEGGMEIALGFSEKFSSLTYLMYEDLLSESDSLNSGFDDAA